MISVEIQFVLINILKFFLQKFTHKLQPVQKAIQIRQRRKRIIRLKLNYIKIYINTHTYKKRNSYLSAYCNHKTKTNKKNHCFATSSPQIHWKFIRTDFDRTAASNLPKFPTGLDRSGNPINQKSTAIYYCANRQHKNESRPRVTQSLTQLRQKN